MTNSKDRGGWITLPFIVGCSMGLSVAAGSWFPNLTSFLVQEYNIKHDVATRVYDIIMIVGVNFFPILGAVIADSFLGSFFVINVASFASLSGLLMLGLSMTVPSLRPPPCNHATICDTPSIYQYSFLLSALSLVTIGFGCTRLMLCSLGIYQFNKPVHWRNFLNVYFMAYEVCWSFNYVVGFIVLDKVNWGLSFGVGIAANTVAIILFLCGSRYYRHITPQANPFIRVAYGAASMMIKGIEVAKPKNHVHNHQSQELERGYEIPPNKNRRKSSDLQGNYYSVHNADMLMNSRSRNQSQLSTLKEAKDSKKVLKMMPVWSAGIVLNTVVVASSNLVVLQASTMDLKIGHHFKLPAGSLTIVSLITAAVTLSIFDRLVFPIKEKLVGRPLRPLQRSGTGHVFVVLGLIGLAIVEVARLSFIKAYNSMGEPHFESHTPMSAYWLVFPLILLGIGLAFYLPGGTNIHYQEYPESLKSCSIAMPAMQIGIGFYLSKALLKVVKHDKLWLVADGRLDLIYWVLALLAAVNFCYYLLCTTLYRYNNYSAPVTSNNNNR